MVVRYQREPLRNRLRKTRGVILPQESAVLPFDKRERDPCTVVAVESFGDFGRDVLIEEELEHTETNARFRRTVLAFHLFRMADRKLCRLRQHALQTVESHVVLAEGGVNLAEKSFGVIRRCLNLHLGPAKMFGCS